MSYFSSLFLVSSSLFLCVEFAHADCPVASNICTLDASYSGDPSKESFAAPPCQSSSTDPITAAEKFFIISAINAAKRQLQTDLCSLTQIFIMRGSSQHSWGFWANPSNHPSDGIAGNTYIAVNVNDMNQSFSAKQDATNTALFGSTIGQHTETNTAQYPFVPELYGLLYALAHEMGHIKWHSAGSNPPCQNDISGNPWNSLGTTPRWTDFGVNFGTRNLTQIPWPQNVTGPDDVYKIYEDTFATALASSNTEEDFVDSYSVRAVYNACKSNQCTFTYQFGNYTVDLNNRGSDSAQKLGKKFTCADGLTG